MRLLFTWLVGLTAGVGVVRITEGLRAAQVSLLAMFAGGAVLGMVAAVMCLAPWAREGQAPPARENRRDSIVDQSDRDRGYS